MPDPRYAEIESHRPYLMRYALSQLRDAQLAEEAVQDALVAALESLPGFDGRSALRTWLTSILRFKAIDLQRRAAAERSHQPLDEERECADDAWLELGPAEGHAWRQRIDGWQAAYRAGLAALGDDFAELDGDAQDERLAADPAFRWLLYEHCCEAVYGDPAYGGNAGEAGWRSVGFPGPPFPRGYTAQEVTGRG